MGSFGAAGAGYIAVFLGCEVYSRRLLGGGGRGDGVRIPEKIIGQGVSVGSMGFTGTIRATPCITVLFCSAFFRS